MNLSLFHRLVNLSHYSYITQPLYTWHHIRRKKDWQKYNTSFYEYVQDNFYLIEECNTFFMLIHSLKTLWNYENMLISEERSIWLIWYSFMHSLINNKMIWNNFLGYRRYKNDRCLIYGIAFFDIKKETWFCVASVGACCIPWYSSDSHSISNYILIMKTT